MKDVQLSAALSALEDGGITDALALMKEKLIDFPFSKYRDTYDSIANELTMMLDYYGKGVADPKRSEVYTHLRRKTVAMIEDMYIDRQVQQDGFLHSLLQTMQWRDDLNNIDEMRRVLENFVTDLAMVDIDIDGGDREEKRRQLYADHHKYLTQLTAALILSKHWRQGDVDAMRELLLTPTVDSRDQQVIVSAIMLNTMIGGDYHKLMLMFDLYEQSTDEYVRQRAFVGWGLALRHQTYLEPIARSRFVEALQKQEVVDDLIQLQSQIFYCLDTVEDNAKIRKDIIPNIINNQHLNVTRFGIEPKEDSMEDIINPGASEKAMEEVEKAMNKMKAMMERGSDIYYGGFSQMKRFPFFYNITNWFCPFYIDHPDLKLLSAELRNSKFMKRLSTSAPFCDSDRYSFALTLNVTLSQMPEAMREMVLNGDAMEMMTIDDASGFASAVIIRRFYLQDLYRFFQLFSSRQSFPDVFKEVEKVNADNVVCYPVDHEYLDGAWREKSEDYCKIKAYRALRHGNDEQAERWLRTALEKGGDASVRQHLANTDLRTGNFKEAAELYAQIIDEGNSSLSTLKKYCAALTNDQQNEKALEVAYKLFYEAPEDTTVVRLLAWNLLQKLPVLEKPEAQEQEVAKAWQYYQQLMAGKDAIADDYYNGALCLIFMDEGLRAADCLEELITSKKAGEEMDVATLVAHLSDYGKNEPMIVCHGKTMEDVQLTAELVMRRILEQKDPS